MNELMSSLCVRYRNWLSTHNKNKLTYQLHKMMMKIVVLRPLKLIAYCANKNNKITVFSDIFECA